MRVRSQQRRERDHDALLGSRAERSLFDHGAGDGTTTYRHHSPGHLHRVRMGDQVTEMSRAAQLLTAIRADIASDDADPATMNPRQLGDAIVDLLDALGEVADEIGLPATSREQSMIDDESLSNYQRGEDEGYSAARDECDEMWRGAILHYFEAAEHRGAITVYDRWDAANTLDAIAAQVD